MINLTIPINDTEFRVGSLFYHYWLSSMLQKIYVIIVLTIIVMFLVVLVDIFHYCFCSWVLQCKDLNVYQQQQQQSLISHSVISWYIISSCIRSLWYLKRFIIWSFRTTEIQRSRRRDKIMFTFPCLWSEW